MNRTSWRKHLDGAPHKAAVQKIATLAETSAAINANYDQIYGMASTSLRTPSVPHNYAPARAHFRPILDEDTNGISTADFDELTHNSGMDHSKAREEEAALRNAELLAREIELLQLRHLDEEFEDADDETIPHFTETFAQEIRENGLLTQFHEFI
jgi:hypothetical protein